jgi:predicted Zn-dependent protease
LSRFRTALIAILLPLSCACAVNPITGRRQVVLSTASQETAVGQNEAQRVADEMGLVDDAQLAAYVATLGRHLVRQFSSTDFAYTFRVVDLPEPNAFALPGGFIYVSRGLLALVNSEDELVTVIGHEIGHVAARHASRRLTIAAPFAIATGITSFATSIVSPTLGNVVSGIGGLTGSLVVAPYSREQEREADRLGMELAARAGWNPEALSRILHTLEREEQLHGEKQGRFSFLASHPSTPERVRNTAEEAGRLSIGVHSPMALDRAAVLRHFDGMVVGADPAQGIFSGNRFLHPELDFTVTFPEGWQQANERNYAAALAPGGKAASIVRVVGKRGELAEIARKTASALGYDPQRDVEWSTVGGNKSAHLAAQARAENGTPVDLDLTWIGHRSGVFEVAGVCERGNMANYGAVLRPVGQSFRALEEPDWPLIQVTRLRLEKARHKETMESLVARSGSVWSAEETAVVNGIEVDTQMVAGFTVKVAVREPYQRGHSKVQR